MTVPFAAPIAGAARWAPIAFLCAALTGCFLAAAGAGAGGAVYLTSRGAESLVDASVEDVASAVEETYSNLGITLTGTTTEGGGDQREMRGKKGDLDVTVKFDRQSPTTTKVEVTARENVAEWDKDYAKRVLENIVERT